MARRTLNIPFNGNLTTTTSVQGNDILQQISDAGMEMRPGFTIVRIRGHVGVRRTTAGGAASFIFGFGMTPEGRFAVIPALFTEIVNFVWRLDSLAQSLSTETSAGNFETIHEIYPIESRGMRKVSRVADELTPVLVAGGGVSVEVVFQGTVRVMLE